MQVLHFDLMKSGIFSVLPWMTMAVTSNVGGWIADTLVTKGFSVTRVRKIMQTVRSRPSPTLTLAVQVIRRAHVPLSHGHCARFHRCLCDVDIRLSRVSTAHDVLTLHYMLRADPHLLHLSASLVQQQFCPASDRPGNAHIILLLQCAQHPDGEPCDPAQIGFLGPAFFLTQLSHVTTPLAAVACMMASQGLDAFSQSGLYSNHQVSGRPLPPSDPVLRRRLQTCAHGLAAMQQ